MDAFPRGDMGGGARSRRRGPQENPRPRRPQALAGFGSAKGSNEEAYLFQKLVRTGFGTNNVDHCTRLCHASSVAALMEASAPARVGELQRVQEFRSYRGDRRQPDQNHPVAATFFKQAAKRGAKLIVMDPRGQALKRHACRMMQFKNGTDVAMLNAMLNIIVTRSSTTSSTSRPTSRASSARRRR